MAVRTAKCTPESTADPALTCTHKIFCGTAGTSSFGGVMAMYCHFKDVNSEAGAKSSPINTGTGWIMRRVRPPASAAPLQN